MKRKLMALLLAVLLVCGSTVTASAAVSDSAVSAALADTSQYLQSTVWSPQVGSVGGEWTVLGLARSGGEVAAGYLPNYYAAVESYVQGCAGKLSDQKYTEYSRLVLALAALGKDAGNVGGYDLTAPLGDYEKTVWQGLNGPVWALLALDSRNYSMPQASSAKTQATRQLYVNYIIKRQHADGGWSLKDNSSVSEVDITAMALQALAKYRNQPAVSKAVEKGLTFLSRKQNSAGGFSQDGEVNSESCAQVVLTLCELNVSLDDARFIKNRKTVVDELLTFHQAGGGFSHGKNRTLPDLMATEQCFCALVSAQRVRSGRNSLYRMGDARGVDLSGGSLTAGSGLPGKHEDVAYRPVTFPGMTFPDITNSPNLAAIESLASRGIIEGRGNGRFDPAAKMTRSEFAAIVVRALGLPQQETSAFRDVSSRDWFAPYVGAANRYGIVIGVGNGRFSPYGTITRQEAGTMVARAARLCGLKSEMGDTAVRNMLAQFSDYTRIDKWARSDMAFCYQVGILNQAELKARPREAVTRQEMAQMLYNLLNISNLL